MTTYDELRIRFREALSAGAALSPDVSVIEADALIAAASGFAREKLFASLRDEVSEDALKIAEAFLERRKLHEPIAYIIGEKEFYGRRFAVGPGVLIPRPETELLVELALRDLSALRPPFTVVDIGVGSGAIILSIIKELEVSFGRELLSSATFIATDKSELALTCARKNAEALGVSAQLSFVQTSGTEGIDLDAQRGQLLFVSNPPYVPDSAQLAADLENFEPKMALRAGAEGLDIIRLFVRQLSVFSALKPRLLMEIGLGQELAVESLLFSAGYAEVRTHKDLNAIPRIVEARY